MDVSPQSSVEVVVPEVVVATQEDLISRQKQEQEDLQNW